MFPRKFTSIDWLSWCVAITLFCEKPVARCMWRYWLAECATDYSTWSIVHSYLYILSGIVARARCVGPYLCSISLKWFVICIDLCRGVTSAQSKTSQCSCSCTSLPLFASIVLLPVVHHVIELGDQEERYKLARRVQTSVIGFGELKECTIGTVLSFFKPKDWS